MSYDSQNLRLIGGVPGQQLFLYRSGDAVEAVGGSGYFNQAVEHYNLTTGDIVLAVTGYGTACVLDALVATVADGVAATTRLS